MAYLGRCGDDDFKLVRRTIERRRPFDLAGPDVDEPRAGVPVAPQAPRQTGPPKKATSRKVVNRSQVRGGFRDMKGGMSLGSGQHNEAKGMLAAASVSTGTKRTYGNAFERKRRRRVNPSYMKHKNDARSQVMMTYDQIDPMIWEWF